MSEIARFSVSIPSDLADAFERRIRVKGYGNRSEAVRDLMRDFLIEAEWESGSGDVMGTATIIYDHAHADLVRDITQMQHDSHSVVVCTTHVHLGERHCMEVLVLRGTASEVHRVAASLFAAKGVKHGKLVCTSLGEGLP